MKSQKENKIMRLAFDIDDTIYDTCNIDKKLRERIEKEIEGREFKDNFERGISICTITRKYRQEMETWNNPDWVIPEAVKALEDYIEKNPDTELYIVTARYVNNKKWFDTLLSKTKLKVPHNRIFMYDYDLTKAQICMLNNIDILIDDATENFMEHRELVKSNLAYKTNFIWYKNPSRLAKRDYMGYNNYRTSKAMKVHIMKDWTEFEGIMGEIEQWRLGE